MKVLIILGICFAFYIQISVQLPAKLNDRKVLPLPIEENKSLKIVGKTLQAAKIEDDNNAKNNGKPDLVENIEGYDQSNSEKLRLKNTFKKLKEVLKNSRVKIPRLPRDAVIVEEVQVFDDALTDDELADLILYDAVGDAGFDEFQANDMMSDTDDYAEFAKRGKRWSIRKSLKKRIKEALEAVAMAT